MEKLVAAAAAAAAAAEDKLDQKLKAKIVQTPHFITMAEMIIFVVKCQIHN